MIVLLLFYPYPLGMGTNSSKYNTARGYLSRGRIHSGKMLLRRVHFTQMKLLPSEVRHADRNTDDD
jgi:hypothetical protein